MSISMIILSYTRSNSSSTKTMEKVNSENRTKVVAGLIRSRMQVELAIVVLIVMVTCSRSVPILRIRLWALTRRIRWMSTSSLRWMKITSIRTIALVTPMARGLLHKLIKIAILTTIKAKRSCHIRQWPITWRCNCTTAFGRTTWIIWRQRITW